MTAFQNFKSMTIDELAEWLDKYGDFDAAPWMEWFDKNYCNKCEGVNVTNGMYHTYEYAWCELHNKCKFFQDMNDVPDSKQTVKMWLESEV